MYGASCPGVLEGLVDEQVIPINPCYRIKMEGKRKKQVKRADYLTQKELSTLLDVFEQYYTQHYPLALTLARTGLRIGEALALQWGACRLSKLICRCAAGILLQGKT